MPLAWLAVAAKPTEVVFTAKEESPNFWIKNIRPNITQKEYSKNIEKIKHFLKEGLSYQVNYTFKMKFDFEGDDFSLYQALRRSQPTSYAALINIDGRQRFLSFSPELFIKIDKGTIKASPMKGTIERGKDIAGDRKNRKELVLSPKIRAENLMIVDLLRNDLGRIARRVKAPKLFSVEKYKTLYQMTTSIEAKLKKSTSLADIFASVFPSGSVTGAPKIKTMQIIASLEKEPRGIYTGAIGYILPQNKACFNVAIRTAALENNKGELGVGGGIVYDSKRKAEYREALLKANFFTKSIPLFNLIETILWSKEKGFWLLDLHLMRLKNSCAYFAIPFHPEKIKMELAKKIRRRKSESRLRLLVDRQGKVAVEAGKLKKLKSPLQARISRKPVDSKNIFLYHKTTQRELYDQERRKAIRCGFFETIFLNKKGEVTEGTISNIFIEKNKKIYTPPVSSGLLSGVFRQYLLNGKKAVEKKLYLKDLKKADKIYIGNSVRGLIEVRIK